MNCSTTSNKRIRHLLKHFILYFQNLLLEITGISHGNDSTTSNPKPNKSILKSYTCDYHVYATNTMIPEPNLWADLHMHNHDEVNI